MPNADAVSCPCYRFGDNNHPSCGVKGVPCSCCQCGLDHKAKCTHPWHDSPGSPAPTCPDCAAGWCAIHNAFRPPAESSAAGKGLIERVHVEGCECRRLREVRIAYGSGAVADPRCLSLRAAHARDLAEAEQRGYAEGSTHDAELFAREVAAARDEWGAWWRASLEKWAEVFLAGAKETDVLTAPTGKYGGTPSMIVQSIVAAARREAFAEAKEEFLDRVCQKSNSARYRAKPPFEDWLESRARAGGGMKGGAN